MKTLILVVALSAMSAGQSGPAIDGSWTGRFQGRTFVRLELSAANGAITGAMSLGDIEVDKQGALRRVGELPRDLKPIFDLTRRGATLTFSRKDVTDTDRFEFTIVAANRAELELLLTAADLKEVTASGGAAPKPISLVKE